MWLQANAHASPPGHALRLGRTTASDTPAPQVTSGRLEGRSGPGGEVLLKEPRRKEIQEDLTPKDKLATSNEFARNRDQNFTLNQWLAALSVHSSLPGAG